LLLHFFGKNGRDTLNYTEFHRSVLLDRQRSAATVAFRFMENMQSEVLEIEFTEFSHGFKTISDLDFAEVLLRYTDFDHDTKRSLLRKVKRTTNQPNVSEHIL
jgi:calcium uptake protein 3, mitochondrial